MQTVFSVFDDGMDMDIGTTSNIDRYAGLAELVDKHILEGRISRGGIQPKKTWIAITSSDGKSSVQTLEDFLKG